MHGRRRLVRIAAPPPPRGLAICRAVKADRYGVFGSSRCRRPELSAAIARTSAGLALGRI
jgi:hypothetical protein